MPGDKLLICITFHNIPERKRYVHKLIEEYSSYPINVDIIVDSNSPVNFHGATTFIHNNLSHPWHLTWLHREHFKKRIDDYDWFMYVEDDMLLPYEGFKEYIENFNILWENNCVPSFIRLEEFEGKLFVTDVTEKQNGLPVVFIQYSNKYFYPLSQPYHAFWIMPQKQLKETMSPNFVRRELSRENAASYPMWELKKTPLIRIENGKVSPLSYSYHLTNNYASFPNTPFGKIEVDNLLK